MVHIKDLIPGIPQARILEWVAIAFSEVNITTPHFTDELRFGVAK